MPYIVVVVMSDLMLVAGKEMKIYSKITAKEQQGFIMATQKDLV